MHVYLAAMPVGITELYKFDFFPSKQYSELIFFFIWHVLLSLIHSSLFVGVILVSSYNNISLKQCFAFMMVLRIVFFYTCTSHLFLICFMDAFSLTPLQFSNLSISLKICYTWLDFDFPLNLLFLESSWHVPRFE